MRPASTLASPALAALLMLLVSSLLPAAQAAISTFQISTPEQCAPLTLTWTTQQAAAGGDVDYNLVLIPTADNDATLSNISFTATGTSYTLDSLPLASGVEFIALLQDATDGADGGRVSQIVVVADGEGGGTSCLDNLPHYLDFTFAVEPTPPNVCETLTVTWQNNATSPIGITGMIPGGESFDIPVTDEGSFSASWLTRIPAGTNVLLAMSDGGARGSGGSSPIYSVGGTNTSCLSGSGLNDAVVYSSLPVGDVPTTLTVTVTEPGGATTVTQLPGGASSDGASSSSGSSGGSKTNVGAIVGGVVGGLAALVILALLLWFFLRRKRRAAETENPEMTTANRPWDPPVPRDPDALPPSSFAGAGTAASTGRPSTDAGSYQHAPSAFSHVPPGAAYAHGSDTNSAASLLDEGRRSTEKRALAASAAGGTAASVTSPPARLSALEPPGALGGRDRSESTGSAPRFVRHEDAGLIERAASDPSAPAALEEETVDLPPLYHDTRRGGPAAAASAGGKTARGGPQAAGNA